MSEQAQDTNDNRLVNPLAPNGSSRESTVPLEKLVLNSIQNKYQLILQTIRWAKELRAREGIPTSLVKLLDRALEDLLTGRVTPEAVQQIAATGSAVAPVLSEPVKDRPAADDHPAKAEKKPKKKAATKKRK